MERLMDPFETWRQWQAFAAASQPAAAGAAGFAPFAAAAERFTAEARRFVDGAAAGAAPAAAAANAFGDFLREQFQDLRMPWSAGPGGTPGSAQQSLLDIPALGAGREHQQRVQRMAEAWRRIEDAQRRLQRLWSDALREAAAGFSAQLLAASAPPQPEALRKLYDEWIDRAEEAYARTAHSEAFCEALADFVNASAAYRNEMQAGIEQGSKWLDLPTRAELNTLIRRVKALEEKLNAAPDAPRDPPRARRAPKRARGKAKR
jgi:class III poly(R)-hydroxyalkanoic acid synthase PhaE subunit